MADKQQPTFDFSKLNFDLSGGGAAAGGFDFTGALQSQLGALIGAESGYFDSLPKAVQRRVRALRNLDREFETVEEEFEKEMRALEIKFHKERFTPLFAKRADIVAGKVEPTDEEAKEEDEDDEEGEQADAKPKIVELNDDGEEQPAKKEEAKEETEEEKNVVGVPDFWLTALKHHELIADAILEKDEEALKFLTDITQDPLDDPEDASGSFTLRFHFAENPFFGNKVLSKTYHLQGDDSDEVVCESVDSTQVNWKQNQNLTRGARKGLGEGCSFFNFFAPPEVKGAKGASAAVISTMELDFEMAVALKEDVIKHAVHWFTGDASTQGLGDFGEEDDEDDDEDGEDGEGGDEDDDEDGEGDDDDEDDDEDGGDAQPGAKSGEQKPECKQQ